jgi:hypothetical protein
MNINHKITKRVFPINISVNKYALAVLLFVSLSACIPEKNQQKLTRPFKCITSQSVCEVTTEFGTFLVKFNVEKVVTELAFDLLVQLKQNPSITDKASKQGFFKVAGYMEGKTMFMGKIPLFFTEIEQKYQQGEKADTSGNNFIAETMLGSCSEDMMTWRLWLTVEKEGIDGKPEHSTFFIDFNSTRF